MKVVDVTERAEELAHELSVRCSDPDVLEVSAVLRALVAEVRQLRDRASQIPGLSAALDEARWERDVVLARDPAAGQAIAEIARLRAELAAERGPE